MSDLEITKPKKEKKSWSDNALTKAAIKTLLKQLKPMVARAVPKFISYMEGKSEDGPDTGEKIIVIMLAEDEDGNSDAIVQIIKSENTQVKYKTSPDEEHSVQEFLEHFISGKLGV